MSDKHQIAREVTHQIAEYELLIDQTLACGGALLARLPIARLETNLAVGIGGEAITAVAASLNAIAQARQHTTIGHHALALARRRLGVEPVSIGDKDDPPPLKGDGKIEAVLDVRNPEIRVA